MLLGKWPLPGGRPDGRARRAYEPCKRRRAFSKGRGSAYGPLSVSGYALATSPPLCGGEVSIATLFDLGCTTKPLKFRRRRF